MKTCENCANEHEGTYGSGRFCSTKCSRGFSTKAKRKEINEKVSNTLKAGDVLIKKCKQCFKEFNISYSKREQELCSRSCATRWKNIHLGIARLGGLASASKNILRSKNEILFAELCQNEFKNILTNECIFNGWDADIIIPSMKIAILWNGKWHYEKITKNHSLEQVQNRDKIKIKEIKNMKYIPYVIKDMGKYDPTFVNKEFNKLLKYIASGRYSISSVS